MKNFITFMFVAFLFLAISCGSEEGPSCDAGEAGAADVVADAKKVDKDDEKYLCYIGCLEAEKTSKDCKKECYGNKKDKGDVVDSPDDATATKGDTVATPADVSGTND